MVPDPPDHKSWQYRALELLVKSLAARARSLSSWDITSWDYLSGSLLLYGARPFDAHIPVPVLSLNLRFAKFGHNGRFYADTAARILHLIEPLKVDGSSEVRQLKATVVESKVLVSGSIQLDDTHHFDRPLSAFEHILVQIYDQDFGMLEVTVQTAFQNPLWINDFEKVMTKGLDQFGQLNPEDYFTTLKAVESRRRGFQGRIQMDHTWESCPGGINNKAAMWALLRTFYFMREHHLSTFKADVLIYGTDPSDWEHRLVNRLWKCATIDIVFNHGWNILDTNHSDSTGNWTELSAEIAAPTQVSVS